MINDLFGQVLDAKLLDSIPVQRTFQFLVSALMPKYVELPHVMYENIENDLYM